MSRNSNVISGAAKNWHPGFHTYFHQVTPIRHVEKTWDERQAEYKQHSKAYAKQTAKLQGKRILKPL